MSHAISSQARSRTDWLLPGLLVLLLALGLLTRLTDLTDLPLDFHPTRQLFSALKARGMYYAWFTPETPDRLREFAIRQWQAMATIEPPVLETLTAVTYRFTGEHVWIARVYSSLFWVLGALAVYAFGKRISSPAGGLLAAAVYLFLPYGVTASRSFQPDPLMVALTAGFGWALLRWSGGRTWRLALAAGLLGGLAVFVKSVAIFFVGGAFAALTLSDLGLRRLVRNGQAWLMLALIVLPTAIYTLYGVFVAGTLGSQFGGRFIPALLIDPLYYLRWMGNVDLAVGYVFFALGALGALLVEERPARMLLIGWWAGYLIYSLIFNYHAATHDYYQLPLIPLVAISLAPYGLALTRALDATGRERARWAYAALIFVFLFAVLTAAYESRRSLRRVDYRPEAVTWAQLGGLLQIPGLQQPVVSLTPAQPAVVGLTQDYGYRAAYWGWFSVTVWPSVADTAYRSLSGNPDEGFAARFAALTAGKQYFLITDFGELSRQPELANYLAGRYPLVARDDRYLIYDLTRGR